MKIYNILALCIAIYASGVAEYIQNASNNGIQTLDSVTNDGVFDLLGIQDMSPLKQEVNNILNNPNNSCAESNPMIAVDEKMDEILNSCFFLVLRDTTSYFLYNISVLKPIFISIHNKQKAGKLNSKSLKKALWKFTVAFRIKVMRELFDTAENANFFQMEHLMRCSRGYLQSKGIHCNNLSYSELREKIRNTDQRFKYSSEDFNLRFEKIEFELLNILSKHLKLSNKGKLTLFNICHSIHDAILLFYSILRHSLNLELYPVLKDYKTLFEWAIDMLIELSNNRISEPFPDAFVIPFSFNFSEIHHIFGFIFSLFKIAQANKTNSLIQLDIFSFVNSFLADLATYSMVNNDNTLLNNPTEKFTDIFTEFLNEVNDKRNKLKNLEEQTKNIYTYQMLNPIIIEFFKRVIKAFSGEFPPFSIPVEQIKN